MGKSSQAFDNGTKTKWYDATNEEGNYWSDWTGAGEYLIDGPKGSVDKYPLKKDINNTKKLIVSIYGLCLFFLSSILFKKKRVRL